MAKLKGDALLGGINLPIPQGTEVVIGGAVDDSLSRFKITWNTPNGPITGTLSTGLLEISKDEIEDLNLPTDKDGLPLYRDLQVKYVGPSNAAITNGDTLIVRDLWYNGNEMECQCLHHGNSRPNTDGRVVVQCDHLRRA